MLIRPRLPIIIFLAVMTLIVCASASLATTEEDARKVVEANQEAVVTVEMVAEISMSFQGETNKQENRASVTATVLDSAGLTVASLAELDPSSFADSAGDNERGFSFSVEVKDLKIKMADGTEMAADIVLRDRDLDLAFVRPKKAPATPLKFVDLTQSASPQIMDQLVVMARLGKVASRSLAACIERIYSVVTKPRTFYVVNPYMHPGQGCPAFTLDGKAVGILVTRSSPERLTSSSEGDHLAIVLPCATIQKAAEQAKSAPAPAKK